MELSQLLTGELRDVYESLYVEGDSYDSVVDRLLVWVTDREGLHQEDAVHRFTEAVMKRGETVSRYAIRLEGLFRKAYPLRRAQDSKALRKKFKATVPADFQRHLLTMESVQHTMHHNDLSWNSILGITSKYAGTSKGEVGDEVWVAQQSEPLRAARPRPGLQESDQWGARHQEDLPPTNRGRPARNWGTRSQSRGRRPVLSRPNNIAVGSRSGHGPVEASVSSAPAAPPAQGAPPPVVPDGSSPEGTAPGVASIADQYPCAHCGYESHSRRTCMRYNRLCWHCGESGHFMQDCKQTTAGSGMPQRGYPGYSRFWQTQPWTQQRPRPAGPGYDQQQLGAQAQGIRPVSATLRQQGDSSPTVADPLGAPLQPQPAVGLVSHPSTITLHRDRNNEFIMDEPVINQGNFRIPL